MTEPSPTPTRRRRRWSSPSLRGMMVLILIVGGFMGWKARRASLQRRAVARIEALGGSVMYDWQERGVGPDGPEWLRRLLGDEYFQEVVEVDLFYSSTHTLLPPLMPFPGTDPDGSKTRAFEEENRLYEKLEAAQRADELSCLEGLDRIESLNLTFGPGMRSQGLDRLGRLTHLKYLVTGSVPWNETGLAQVAKLKRLEKLSISLKLSDDSALELLKQLPNLKILDIEADFNLLPPSPVPPHGPLLPENSSSVPDAVTDSWLARLGRLSGLEDLRIDGPEITDAGLAHLKGLTNLVYLNLAASHRITDAGLVHLKGMAKLDGLNLKSATGITDEGLAHLTSLDSLQSLQLTSASKITDAGLDSLAKMPQLAILDLNVHSLTDAGLNRLKSMPNLQILSLTGGKIKGEILDAIQAAIPGLRLTAERMGDEPGAESGEPTSDPTLIPPPVSPRN